MNVRKKMMNLKTNMMMNRALAVQMTTKQKTRWKTMKTLRPMKTRLKTKKRKTTAKKKSKSDSE